MSNGYDMDDYASITIAHNRRKAEAAALTRREYPPKLIGLGGKLRAGKGVVAEYLAAQYGYVSMGMSDALNDALLSLNPWILSETGEDRRLVPMRYQDLHARIGYVEAKKNPEVRRLLQALGTEVGRDMIGENTWVDIAEQTIRRHWADGNSVVIDGIRFPNELELMERLGGLTLWIDRDDSKRLEGTGVVPTPDKPVESVLGAPESLTGHASENSVSPHQFDVVFSNNGTLDMLYTRVEESIR